VKASEKQKWLAQWRQAGPALAAFRTEELSRLDEARNAVIASTFCLAENPSVRRVETSGLFEQQAIFRRALTR
jgi:hypothetical protein